MRCAPDATRPPRRPGHCARAALRARLEESRDSAKLRARLCRRRTGSARSYAARRGGGVSSSCHAGAGAPSGCGSASARSLAATAAASGSVNGSALCAALVAGASGMPHDPMTRAGASSRWPVRPCCRSQAAPFSPALLRAAREGLWLYRVRWTGTAALAVARLRGEGARRPGQRERDQDRREAAHRDGVYGRQHCTHTTHEGGREQPAGPKYLRGYHAYATPKMGM